MLSDPKRRSEYDEARRLFGSGGFRPGAPGGSRRLPRWRARWPAVRPRRHLRRRPVPRAPAAGRRPGRHLRRPVQRRRPGRHPQPQQAASGPARGQDVETEVTLAFDEAVLGVDRAAAHAEPGHLPDLPRQRREARAPARTPARCATARVSPAAARARSRFSEPCRECRGTGSVVDDPCPDCQGSGVTNQTRTITVRIPAGVKDGQRIRLAGKGAPGRRGGPAGDLFVVVHVSRLGAVRPQRRRPDPHRAGDLRRGGARDHAHRAHARRLGLPQGAGRHLERADVPGPRTRRARARAASGDLLVTVEVAVPARLTPRCPGGHREAGRRAAR